VTYDEFSAVMAYLGEGTGKPLSVPGAEVYFDLLGDLPAAALQVAARRALLEGQFPVFPPPGVLRRLAVEALMAGRGDPPPEEAWDLVRQAISAFGYYRGEAAMGWLPPLVWRAVKSLGWLAMCDSTEPEILRAQFRRAYESLYERAHREALLPAHVRAALAEVAAGRALPGLPAPHTPEALDGERP
jgi:hypothetical protein